MTRLEEESKKNILQVLPSEAHLAQSEEVYAVENLSDDKPDGKVPVLVPEGANKAQFVEVAERVLDEMDDDTDWIDFQTDVWEIYRKKYGVVTND